MQPELSKSSLQSGIWKGVLAGAEEMPEIVATHLETPVSGVRIIPSGKEGEWLVEIPVPQSAVSDGTQTVVIREAISDTTLGSFTVISGNVLSDDLRAEVDLLRAELDMLKRAFRRHCIETGG